MAAGCADPGREFGAGAHIRHLLRGWLDPAIERRADYPRCRHHPAAARQYWASGRRHYGPARACLHSGFDRCADAVRSPGRVHATASRDGAATAAFGALAQRDHMGRKARCAVERTITADAARVHRCVRAEAWLVVKHSSLYTEPAASLVWRCRERGRWQLLLSPDP